MTVRKGWRPVGAEHRVLCSALSPTADRAVMVCSLRSMIARCGLQTRLSAAHPCAEAGWRCSPDPTQPRTSRSWCVDTRSPCCAEAIHADVELARPGVPQCAEQTAPYPAAPAAAGVSHVVDLFEEQPLVPGPGHHDDTAHARDLRGTGM